ncbi:PREDICTED: 39S ribosomal protein L17, mitochondrial [Gekko japonicus]|uniref:Large ribosomal subunit protein bL17m n=1 Tax=Gekko japonicus TaxID=146911 RepID=A0ABM1LAC9_GEKJA|nr:PREDICTED: 39S ribosomal protein L17, mitochondrial [Gekko japonicus]
MRLSAAAWISHGRVFRRLGRGPRNRLDLLRNLVTALVRHERIETIYARADEMRGYAERLIDYAKRGDTDPKAMRMADFWLTEKDLIHKLFKVLAPRYQLYSRNYTRLLQIPNRDDQDRARMAVIEYKGNPLPPLPIPRRDSEKTLVNQLLKGYRDDVLRVKGAPHLEEGHVGTAV